MLRWRMLTGLGLVSLVIGCTHATATTVDFSPRPAVGLANAPALYGSAPSNDQRQHDVVSNGLESCGRYLENGVLRYQWPPCPAPQVQSQASFAPTAASVPLVPISRSATSAASVTPWHEKFVVEWPCAHKPLDEGESLAVVACTVPEF
jgi:hypothetical protein